MPNGSSRLLPGTPTVNAFATCPAPVHVAGRAAWRQIAERVEHALDDPDHLACSSWSQDTVDRLVVQLIESEPFAKDRLERMTESAVVGVEIAQNAPAGTRWLRSREPVLRTPDRDQGLDLGL